MTTMTPKEPERILGWAVDKNLADFEPLISNLRQEGSSRADLVQYLGERIKLVEARPTITDELDWDDIRAKFEEWYVQAIADEIRDEITQSTEKIRELVTAQLKGT